MNQQPEQQEGSSSKEGYGVCSSSSRRLLRVWGLTVKASDYKRRVRVQTWEAALWRCMDIITAANEITFCASKDNSSYTSSSSSPSTSSSTSSALTASSASSTSALRLLDIDFDADVNGIYTYAPLLAPLLSSTSTTTTPACPYAATTAGLEVLRIAATAHDESKQLGLLNHLKHLRELSFENCRLSDASAMDGVCCGTLKKVTLCGQLPSIDSLAHLHAQLEELNVSINPITSVHLLRPFKMLSKVCLFDCCLLTSLQGLEGHVHLKEIKASGCSVITSIQELHSCPALEKVLLSGCLHLTSLDGLEGHQWLTEINVRRAPITTIRPLQSCPALKIVDISGCKKLRSLADGFGGSGGGGGGNTNASSSPPRWAATGGNTDTNQPCITPEKNTTSSTSETHHHPSTSPQQWHPLQEINLSDTFIPSVRELLDPSRFPALKKVNVTRCGKQLLTNLARELAEVFGGSGLPQGLEIIGSVVEEKAVKKKEVSMRK